MSAIPPPCLKPGDLIGIVSPASPLRGEKLQNLKKGMQYLRRKGYQLIEGKNARKMTGYLAGSDAQRLADLNDMIRNPQVRAIFATRGGYGTARLLPHLDYKALRRDPKIVVGYSDITSLQLALFSQTGLITFSGPMVAVEMGKGIEAFTETNFWPLITRAELQSFVAPRGVTFRPGTAEGRLLGGCFSLINPAIGTPFLPDLRGAVLLMEDICEDVYRLDRYFAQLRNSGILFELAGIILGDFIDCENTDPDSPSLTIEQIIYDYTHDLSIPVLGSFPYGHGDIKYTLPIGCRVRLDATQHTCEMLEPGVSDE
ncbi:LD-carboxypeptidase [candidate division KSB1 bacterium]|nr:LD-carboxypeptidase [candidate division KSB1 bacterium]